MAKKKIRYGKLFCTGFLWLPLYIQLMSYFCFQLFGFRILSRADWQKYFNDFLKGKWVIDTGFDLALLLSMVLFVPLFLIGWYIVYKIHWKKLIFRKKTETVAPVPSGQFTPKKTFEPGKLRVQSSAILSVPLGGTSQEQVSPSVEPVPQSDPQSVPQQPAFDDEEDVQKILTLVGGVKADFFPHVNLDGHYASFALSTEKRAAVFKIINQENSTWAVDTEIPISESDWFYETGILPTPAKDILAVAQNLHENEPESLAVPVILLMSGRLLNTEEAMDYFEKNEVILLRMPEVEADDVPLFQDFLEEFFGEQDEVEQPETTE